MTQVLVDMAGQEHVSLCLSGHVAEMSWCCQALLAETSLVSVPDAPLHGRPLICMCSPLCLPSLCHACPVSCPTEARAASNCGECRRGLIIRVKYLINRSSPVICCNKSLFHLYKHATCHGSPPSQNGTFCSHDPLGADLLHKSAHCGLLWSVR